ncbi:tail fiber assembly protein [Roseobacter phage CRP-125]|uniref:Tail fiber assembly protein n=1 Tax=Roseobacter phage CRP-125 TaxID=3072844 RepID=A0AAX3ZWI2_9CAUD|nr:tail fiber assembly protein [Roseobacter phage CRP-125]
MSISITEARNGAYIDANGTIDCEINHPEHGWIPYTVVDSDTDTTIDNEAIKALLGNNIAAYVPPTQEELDLAAAASVRFERDQKLATEVDPIVSNPLRWGSLSDEQQLAFTVYRQNLLDITEQEGFPHNVVWPTKPEV